MLTFAEVPPKLQTSGSTASFAIVASEANVTLECSLNGAAFSPCAGANFTLSGLADQRHQMRVRATDEADNTGPTLTDEFTIGGCLRVRSDIHRYPSMRHI